MKNSSRATSALLVLLLAASARAQTPASRPSGPFETNAEAEQFLKTAKIVSAKGTKIGVTGPQKLTLDDGTVHHPAVFKNIDERKLGVTTLAASTEMDFKDSWLFEVAAYELDKLLGLGMVPVTVERSYNGKKGSLQIWINDCIMESDRLKRKLDVPDPDAWNEQMFKVRVFDNLVYNIDRNLGNVLITPQWKVYMIDHSRAFKSSGALRTPKDLTRFSRSMMEKLEQLSAAAVNAACGKYLTPPEIKTMLERRDKIVALYSKTATSQSSAIYR
jgi:hypothetical protein